MDEQEIKIVRVTTSDYNKVMDIFPPSEIYEGTDYLPDYFHLLLEGQITIAIHLIYLYV
jgi:hypothetical protein